MQINCFIVVNTSICRSGKLNRFFSTLLCVINRLKMSGEETTSSWNPKRFDGSEYSKFRLRFMLFVKKKEWYTVLENSRPTTDDNKIAAWDKIDVKVQSTLVNAVSDRILDEIQHETTAKGMVDSLDSVYLRKTLMMRVLAKKRLLNLKIEEGEDAQVFFGRFEKHISALKDAGETISAEEKLSYLLIILPEKYAHIIDVLDALPEKDRTVDYVKGKMMFDHCRAENTHEVFGDGAALKTQVQNRFARSYGGTPGPNYRCHKCGVQGHFRRDCQAGFAQNNSSSGSNTNSGSFGRKDGGNRRNVCTNNTEVADVEVNAFQVRVMSSKVSVAEKVSQEAKELNWVMDSGCTDHIVVSDRYFCSKEKLKTPITVKVADGFLLKTSFIGNIRMYTVVNGRKKYFYLKNVYLTPELGSNLLSFDRITKAGFSILAEGDTAEIRNPLGDVVAIAKKSNKLYELMSYVLEDVVCSAVDVSDNVTGLGLAEKWHRMLGHINYGDLGILCSKQLLEGLPKVMGKIPESCDTCLQNKFCNLGHPAARARAKEVLEMVHSDVNIVTPKGFNGEIGFVTFIDDFSRLACIYCIKSKSEVFDKFFHYVNTMTNLVGKNIKILRCDRGTEYLNKRFDEFCSSRGILIKPSPAYVHELNGTAERYNRTVMNRARCLVSEAGVGKQYWPECVRTAAYLGNRSLANTVEQKTPFEIFFGKRPNVTNLKFVGASVFVRIPEVKRKCKIDPKAEKGVLLGYTENGYRVLVNGVIKETPYVRLAEQKSEKVIGEENSVQKLDEHSTDEEDGSGAERGPLPILPTSPEVVENSQSSGNQEEEPLEEYDGPVAPEISSRPVRERKAPVRLDDYVIEIKLCTCACAPDTFREAMDGENSVKWKHSMDEEMENFRKNDVWNLVDPPVNCKIIPVKWVYRVKSTGKFKSRLVAVGFRQPYDKDEETYSPVAAMATLRVILSVSCRLGYFIHQMDVEGAFLNGDVRGEVYVSQPKGYDQGDGKVYKLRKALYGLRESPRAWYDCFHSFMVELGFHCSDYDCCLYIKFVNNSLLGLILYVDDLLIFSQMECLVTGLKDKLKQRFRMTDLGQIKNYLGIAVKYDREARVMELDQSEYIESLAKKYRVDQMRSYKTPMERNLELVYSDNCDDSVSDYRRLIGALLFVGSGTRLDASFAINYLSRFQKCADGTHFRYALRVLKYLQGTQNLKLRFDANSNQVVEGWADADWAADSIDRKSTGGILIRVFGNPVIWICRKQNSVTRASTYAEYIALADAVTELFPVVGVLKNLKVCISGPVPVYEDNSSALILANKGKFTKRGKHIEVAYKFVADYVSKGLIVVHKVDSKSQLADILTKSLGTERFVELRAAVSIK